ncbi:MAG: hypothetical protein QN229_07045 [Desulfurococcaceae archaeon TW002]
MNDWLSPRILFVLTIFSLLSFLTVCYTSAYVFFSIQVILHPQSPPVVFSGLNEFFICTDLVLYKRNTLVFSDFESYPLPGWGNLGGSWDLTSGYKGNGLLGKDNDGGPGGSSFYYWSSSISAYDWLSISSKVLPRAGGWHGVSLLQRLTRDSRLYEISIYVTGNRGFLEIWYYSGRSWVWLGRSESFFSVDFSTWFILYINYSRIGRTNYISARIYSVGGIVLASLNVNVEGPQYFVPSYVSVSVDSGVGVREAVFDDFVVSVSDPRYVYVEGVPQGFILGLYDDLGNKVTEAISPGGTTYLNVLSDVVVGRGFGGVFQVYDTSRNLCLSKNFVNPIVGSDTYVLVVHRVVATFYDENTLVELQIQLSSYDLRLPKTVVLNVVSVDVNPYYAGLILYPEYSLIQSDLRLVLEISNGTSSDSLIIDGGSPPPNPVETDLLKIDSNVNLVVSVEVSKENVSTSRIYLELVYCVDPQSRGVCVYYPIILEV